MSSITAGQRQQVITLLQEGQLDRDQIATRVGVAPGTVSAIKAHITMGSYTAATKVATAETDELIEAAEATFGLERDLQKALRANIQQLEDGLEIIDEGKEYWTVAGRLDILCKDRAGEAVVIELKAGQASPDALTQLLAYMGEITKEGWKTVRGILVAGDFHPRIGFAVQACSNVQLLRYSFKFYFEPYDSGNNSRENHKE